MKILLEQLKSELSNFLDEEEKLKIFPAKRRNLDE